MTVHTFAISAYQDSPYLEACIKSLKKQSVPSDIILCTSTPSDYITNLAKKYQIPVFENTGEGGIGADWNFAYHKADSELVTIAHQDDMYHKDYGKELRRWYAAYPDMTLFTSANVTVKHGALQPIGRMELVKKLLRLPLRIPVWNHHSKIKKSVLIFGNSICCPACTYSKKQLGEPLFTSLYQFALDWDTLWTLAEIPGRFICVEKPLLYYRIHEDATTKGCIINHSREREERSMYRKLWPESVVRILYYFYRKAYEAYN